MRNGSRDKGSQQQNRLIKTQMQKQPSENMDNTNYHINQKSEASKLPPQPRAGSSQKLNYNIQENMTESRILEAKKGLMLLKKKMSRNGMSRQKVGPSIQKKQEKQQETAYEPIIKKTVSSKPQMHQESKQYEQLREKKNTPKIPNKPSVEDSKKPTPKPTQKSIDDLPIRSQNPKTEYVNKLEEVPISKNQDFFALLQKQMAKEKANQKATMPAKQKIAQYNNEENIELIECSKGCGRQFNINAIVKHQKICQKVFQSKRKAFDSAAHRIIQAQEIPKLKEIVKGKEKKNQKVQNKAQKQEKGEKIPKWKLQSNALRVGLKLGKNQQLTNEEKVMAEAAQGMIQCNFCGRKFAEQPGKRHIAFCESKSKQLPKMNTKKK